MNVGFGIVHFTEPYEVARCESEDDIEMLGRGSVQIDVVTRWVGRECDFQQRFLDWSGRLGAMWRSCVGLTLDFTPASTQTKVLPKL